MDATCLNVPADFERLPEFRLLCAALESVKREGVPSKKIIEAVATFLFMRLWVELSLLAQSTNRPGYLSSEGKRLFEGTVQELFGEDCEAVKLLTQCGLLAGRANEKEANEEWFCERFARLNGHTAGNFVKREVKGAHASALVRRGNDLAKAAMAQAMLLPPELFKKRDGTAMNDSEVNRAMVLIKTLDSCLRSAGRPAAQYTEGLVADAAAVSEQHRPEELRPFYEWLMSHRSEPGLPKTAEGILSQWELVSGMMK